MLGMTTDTSREFIDIAISGGQSGPGGLFFLQPVTMAFEGDVTTIENNKIFKLWRYDL